MLKIHDITKKYPFMYEVNDQIFCMGQGVFQIYTDVMGLEYFKKYRNEITFLGREFISQPYPDHRDVKNLVHYYERVKTYSESTTKTENPAEVKAKLLAFLDSLTPDEQDKLSKQLEDYINVFRHYNRNWM